MAAQASRRRNGLSPPYTPAQISVWILFIATAVQFLVFIAPVLPLVVAVPLTIYFFAVFGTVFYYAAKTLVTDPIDIHLVQSLRGDSDSEGRISYFRTGSPILDKLYHKHNHPGTNLPTEEMKQCWICDTMVADHAMHCKFCNKCVYHFDHHCMCTLTGVFSLNYILVLAGFSSYCLSLIFTGLNTCVGSANYEFFYRTMQFIFLMEVSHLGILVGLALDYFIGGSRRFDDWFGADLGILVLVVDAAFIVFSSGSVVLLGQLLLFHVNLRRKKLTTYQFIVQDHKKKRDIARQMDDLNNQRVLSMSHAHRDGKSMRAWHLRLGGHCRSAGCPMFDPLKLPEYKEPRPEDGFAVSLGQKPTGAYKATKEMEDIGNGTLVVDDADPETSAQVST